jgi:hypothetical protein
MVKRTQVWVGVVLVVLLVMPLAGCTGGDAPEEAEKPTDNAVVGSFVGEVSDTEAFVAVVAAPAEGGEDSGAVQIFVSDGRGLSEWFSGPITDSSFFAKSDDGDAETKGKLTVDSVTGTVDLPSGRTVRYQASPPSGAAGLYELTVSSAGELSGASAAGLGVTGQITIGKRTGMLRLVDGKRLEFSVTRTRAGDLAHLRAGQVRLIVLSDGELRGAGKARPAGRSGSDLFIRSA